MILEGILRTNKVIALVLVFLPGIKLTISKALPKKNFPFKFFLAFSADSSV